MLAFDPEAMPNVKKLLGDSITFVNNQYEAVKGVDALIIVTEWSVFRAPDFELLAILMNDKVIFDGRNVYDLKKMQTNGYYYNSIGRAIVSK